VFLPLPPFQVFQASSSSLDSNIDKSLNIMKNYLMVGISLTDEMIHIVEENIHIAEENIRLKKTNRLLELNLLRGCFR
jgi:hypothetical protein